MRYRTIVADPPWEYERGTPPWRSTSEPTYSLMSVQSIAELPVPELASDDAHLYLWSVLPLIPQALSVIAAWGFAYETMVTWCKKGPGLGGGFRGNTEQLLIAKRGDNYLNPTCATCGGRQRGARKCGCTIPDWRAKGQPWIPSRSFSSVADGTWYIASRGEHSAKPDLFMDLAEHMSEPPRLEMFARRARFGWDYWGDESLGTAELAAPA